MKVKELLETEFSELRIEALESEEGLEREILFPDLYRPGLALTGYFEYFAWEKIQVLGKTETEYLKTVSPDYRKGIFRKMMGYSIPCIVLTRGLNPPEELLEESRNTRVSVLRTPVETSKFMNALSVMLENRFAPKTTIHGVLLDIYGIGTLITGTSGAGKSECALELIEKGHRIVADDVVEIRKMAGDMLIGKSIEPIKHHMEIRGLGIINIKELFGVSAVRDEKHIELSVVLEEWKDDKEYDRLGIDDKYDEILEIKVPKLEIPIRPGRSIAVIIEVAAINHRLKMMGYHSAKEFDRKLLNWISKESKESKNK